MRGRLREPKTLLFPMLQRDLGVRKQGMRANLSSGPNLCKIEFVRGRLREPKTLLFPMLQRDLGVRKQGVCANLSSGPKNGTGNIQNPIATARFRCPETGTVCKFVHRSQKSYCYGAISDQNSDVQKFTVSKAKSYRHSASQPPRTHARTNERTQNMRKSEWGFWVW